MEKIHNQDDFSNNIDSNQINEDNSKKPEGNKINLTTSQVQLGIGFTF